MEAVEEDTLSTEEIKEIKESLEELHLGKTKPIEQVAKEIGIALT
jgi:hypothetical protein